MTERRTILKGAAMAGASLLVPQRGRAAASRSVRTVSIFHTTDLHGHIRPAKTYDSIADVGGLARCATQIRRWRSESPHHVLVDLGDVYQGTPVGWMTRGRLMIDLLNKLGYDAWVMGNHEFDWGPEVVLDAVSRSTMPILTGNMKLDGEQAGTVKDTSHPFAKIVPHIVKSVGGFRIGILGLSTPGLPFWLRPDLLRGFDVTDPVEAMQTSIKFMREEGKVDAVIACGHMGLTDRDDFANRVNALLASDDGPDVYLGGHTHRDHSSRYVGRTLYTQSDYFGIHCGRVDLSFDLESRRLVEKRAYTILMDQRVVEDPVVLEAAAKDLNDADTYLEEKIGDLATGLSDEQTSPGNGSPLQRLIASSMLHAATKHGLVPDGAFHGTFRSGPLQAGAKTIADAWDIIPYDNNIWALYLTRQELAAIMNESLAVRSDRALFGFKVAIAQSGAGRWESRGGHFVRDIKPLRGPNAPPADYRFCVLFNSYDVQSGGKRLMRLRALASDPEVKATMLPPSSRQALIDFFADRGTVKESDLSPLPELKSTPPAPQR